MLGQETELARCPDWYPLFQAAKYLGVPPWELLDKSVYWLDKALIAISAENGAQEQLAQRNKK